MGVGMNERDRMALLILRDVLDCEPDERGRLIDERCTDDPVLRDRVRVLVGNALAIEQDDRQSASVLPPEQPVEDALPGSRLGPFRVVERIGRGGMGVVYRGEREADDVAQTVAIKLIRRGFDFDDVHARFLRERRILASLSHPNIARFIDGGVAPDGRPWFALEFVRGETITAWCDARRLDARARVRLFLEACAAVQYAHTQLIVHRDLKPGNVLVDERGAPRLLDFGIARLVGGDDEGTSTLTLANMGYALTPEYAAPEQFTSSAVGVAADVYALGVILHELLAGVGPYVIDRHDLLASQRTVREAPPEPLLTSIGRVVPGVGTQVGVASTEAAAARLAARGMSAAAYRSAVRGDLTRIVQTALAKEPERRYATVDAFAADLSRWMHGAPVRVSGNGFGYRFDKFVRRNRVAVTVAGGLAFGLIAMSVLALRSAMLERQQRETAVAEAERAMAVRDYVQLMFRNVAEQPEGSKTTARDALKLGAEQIFVQFKDQPKTGQATALSLSELYMQLGDANGGAALLERLLAWPGIEENPDVQASGRYHLAQLEYSRGERARARSLLDQAQAWWNSDPERHRDILLESRTAQAQIERGEGKLDQAITTLEAAIAERYKAPMLNAREVASALNSLSLALYDAGRYDDALQRAGEGYDLMAEAGLDTGIAALALLNSRGNALLAMGRADAAAGEFRRVADSRLELYGRSPEVAGAQANLANALLAQAKALTGESQRATRAEAVALLEDSFAMAIEGSGEKGRPAAFIRYMLAEAYVLIGAADKAAPLAEAAVRIGMEQFGESSPLAALGLRSRAKLRAALGELEGARSDIAAARPIFVAMGKGGERHLKVLDAILDPVE
jgi:eukaryotic-like serine/threonine-protein kinase